MHQYSIIYTEVYEVCFLPDLITNPLEDGIMYLHLIFCFLHYFKHFKFWFLIIELYLSIVENLENIDNP